MLPPGAVAVVATWVKKVGYVVPSAAMALRTEVSVGQVWFLSDATGDVPIGLQTSKMARNTWLRRVKSMHCLMMGEKPMLSPPNVIVTRSARWSGEANSAGSLPAGAKNWEVLAPVQATSVGSASGDPAFERMS